MKQILLGRKIGGAIDTFQRSLLFVTIINFTMLAATFYNTTGASFIIKIFPWFNFYIFMAFLIIVVFIAMIFVYVFITPSSMAYASNQSYVHDNPLKKQMDRIEKTLEDFMQHPDYKDWTYIGTVEEHQVYQKGNDLLLCRTVKRCDGMGTDNTKLTLARVRGELHAEAAERT